MKRGVQITVPVSKIIIQRLFYIYIVSVVVLCVVPINTTSSDINEIYIIDIRFDYLTHFLMFIPFLVFGRLINESKIEKPLKYLLGWLFMGICFAIASEVIQLFLSYRAYNINDIIANITGILLGLFSFLFRLNTTNISIK